MKNFDEKKWIKDIDNLRVEKDKWMKHSPNSPIPHEIRHRMKGLEYFPSDLKYRFEVKLNIYSNPEKLIMATSKGQQREYVRYGFFEFVVESETQRIQVYKTIPKHEHGHSHEGESLFIPFRDSTSGKESYGAARYIDLEMSPSGLYTLDFNLAYNPYCVYNDNYVCPFPPPENWLQIPIRAGEKNFKK